jgi:hypothetical protein
MSPGARIFGVAARSECIAHALGLSRPVWQPIFGETDPGGWKPRAFGEESSP